MSGTLWPDPTGSEVLMALTDDEAVALALRAGHVWPAALPTEDMGDEGHVAAAGFRGARSLIARALLTVNDGVVAAPLETVFDAVFNSGPVLAVCPASADLSAVYRDWAMVYFDSPPEDWLVDAVSSRGIHVFERVPNAVGRQRVHALFTAVFDGDDTVARLLGESPESIVAAGRPSTEGTRSLSVRRGEAVLMTTVGGVTIRERDVERGALSDALEGIASAG